jgi:hypothetical protein
MRSKEVTAQSLQSLMSDVDLAAFFGVKVSTIRKWRILGIGPRWIKMGRLVRYRPDDALAFLESRSSGGGRAAAA